MEIERTSFNFLKRSIRCRWSNVKLDLFCGSKKIILGTKFTISKLTAISYICVIRLAGVTIAFSHHICSTCDFYSRAVSFSSTSCVASRSHQMLTAAPDVCAPTFGLVVASS